MAEPVRAASPATATKGTKASALRLRRKCACGGAAERAGECEDCRRQRLRRRRADGADSAPAVAPPIVHEVLRSPGRGLDPAVGGALVPGRFDLRRVRIHADAQAAASARAVDALAYTVGRHVVFGVGEYRPATSRGRQLLAHELVHVAQQGDLGGVAAGERIEVGGDRDRAESEARAGERAAGAAPAAGPAPAPDAWPRLRRVSFGQGLLHIFGAGAFPHEELLEYLRQLDVGGRIEGGFFSDDKAREVVGHWESHDARYELTPRLKSLLVQEMLDGVVLEGDENGILAILRTAADDELALIVPQADEAKLRDRIDDDQRRAELDRILAAWRRRIAGGVATAADEAAGAADSPARLLVYLRTIDVADAIERGPGSHRSAQEVVRLWSAGDERFNLPPRRKELLVDELLHGTTGAEDRDAILALLRGARDAEMRRLLAGDREARLVQGFGDRADDVRQVIEAWRTRARGQEPDPQRAVRRIDRIVVDQEIPQTVTVHWRGGGVDSDICSTGKGHCCVGENDAQGASCTEAGSRVNGSNCTAVGRHTVIRKIPRTEGGVELWTEFVGHPRDIALHDYEPRIDGTPLSHGCVRLKRPMAQLIFDGAVIGRTQVEVRGLARPRCNWPALQAEWMGDFRTAATVVPDGEAPALVRERRSVRRERATLREVYDIDDQTLGAKLATLQERTGGLGSANRVWGSSSQRRATLEAIGPVVEEIPRCVPTQTVEERRATAAPEPAALVAGAGLDALVTAFTGDLRGAANLAAAEAAVRRNARELWNRSVQRAQGGDTDDRPLYWARLQMARALRAWEPSWLGRTVGGELQTPDDIRRQRGRLIELFEQASRGMDTATFAEGGANKRILISGFDPFGLGEAIDRGNPSGAAVLALDGTPVSGGGVTADVQGVVFPVRFDDFDAGAVESFFRPQLTGPAPPHMIMTISQGVGSEFEVERFAGRRRSSGGFESNEERIAGGSRQRPAVPPGLAAGPEFLETSLPVGAIRGALGRRTATAGETEFTEIRRGESRPVPGGAQPSAGATAVRGSGGGFLSNEIFYRAALLRQQTGASVRLGHLHTPELPLPGSTAASQGAFTSLRDTIVATVRRILVATLGSL